tara:strand:- start:450 stop:839 length:390 start_codon:yes stop_codon:yes gene_type:complete
MSESINIEIISPEKKLLTEKVNAVTLPAYEGEMTILSNHIPLITFLRPGIIKVAGSKETHFFTEEGTVEFSNNNLSILSSTVIEINALSKEKISEMIEEAKGQLNKENTDDKKRYIASHKIDCLTRINL